MSEIVIKIEGIETLNSKLDGITDALLSLTGNKAYTAPVIKEVIDTTAQVPVQQPVQTQDQPSIPQQPIVQQATSNVVPIEQPQVQTQPQPQPVATQGVSYTQQDLALAATQLMDSGRIKEVQDLMSSFGVIALTQLPQEQYGNFAIALRNMGARI